MRSFFLLILYLKLLKRTQSFFIEELMITEDNFFRLVIKFKINLTLVRRVFLLFFFRGRDNDIVFSQKLNSIINGTNFEFN